MPSVLVNNISFKLFSKDATVAEISSSNAMKDEFCRNKITHEKIMDFFY